MPMKKPEGPGLSGFFNEAGDEARTHDIYLGKVKYKTAVAID
jgi:hypothetical protein